MTEEVLVKLGKTLQAETEWGLSWDSAGEAELRQTVDTVVVAECTAVGAHDHRFQVAAAAMAAGR